MGTRGGRELWMDRLRGVAVLLVILWHAVSIPVAFGSPMPRAVEIVNDALSPYRIPALLVLSGLLLQQSLRKPLGRYYWGKAANVVWPFLLWSAFYLLSNPGVDGSSWVYWLGGSYLWYLVVVGFCYAIGPIVRWIPALVVAAALIVVLVFSGTANSIVLPVLQNAPYFFIGAAAVPIRDRVLQAPGWIVILVGAVAVAWGAYSAISTGYSPRVHPVGLPISLLGIFCLSWVLNRPKKMRGLEWVGRHSLVFYVSHFPAMVIACRVGAVDFPAPLVYVILLAVGIGVAFVFSRFFANTLLFQLPMRWRTKASVDPHDNAAR